MYAQTLCTVFVTSGVGSLAAMLLLAVRQRWSTGLRCGHAVGRNRSSIPIDLANRRMTGAFWAECLSRNRTTCHPRHFARTLMSTSSNSSCVYFSDPYGQKLPFTMLRTRVSPTRRLAPTMGTSSGHPIGDQARRRGATSLNQLVSRKSRTVRFRPKRPRWSPLLPASRSVTRATACISAACYSTRLTAAHCERLPERLRRQSSSGYAAGSIGRSSCSAHTRSDRAGAS